MKTLLFAALGLLAVICLPALALAGPELYFLGGGALTNLGSDATLFGHDLAAQLNVDPGGVWTADKGSRMGYDVGLGISYMPPASALGLAAELRYARRGAKWELNEATGTYTSITTKLKFSYLEIPVLLQITPGPEAAAVRPMLVAGPVLGIRTSSDFAVEAPGAGEVTQDFSDATKSTHVGATFGAGLRIRAGATSAVLIQARALLGLSNLLEDNVANYSMKPQDFSLLVGYSFGL